MSKTSKLFGHAPNESVRDSDIHIKYNISLMEG